MNNNLFISFANIFRDQLAQNLDLTRQKLLDAQEDLVRRSQVESKLRRELQGAHSLIAAKHSRGSDERISEVVSIIFFFYYLRAIHGINWCFEIV